MKIGEKIKARRIELGLSVDELAEKIGKNRSTVYRYENEEIENLPTPILKPLVKALQVPPDYFMDWEDLPSSSSDVTPEAAETASMIHEAENTEEIITIVETVIEDEDYRAIVTASKELSPDEMKMVRAMIEGLVSNKE